MSSRDKSFTTHVVLNDDDVDVEVFYTVSGKHVKAKLYGDNAHPAEYPEIEITRVEDMNGADVTELVDIDELITEAEQYCDEPDDDRGYED